MIQHKTYNKLVRDKIPSVIKQDGYTPIFKTLTKIELEKELRTKLLEESLEVQNSKTKSSLLEELADVHEVLKSLARINNISFQDITKTATIKREKRGSFNKGIFLIKIK